jgi:hypothetical protein
VCTNYLLIAKSTTGRLVVLLGNVKASRWVRWSCRRDEEMGVREVFSSWSPLECQNHGLAVEHIISDNLITYYHGI